MTTGLDKSKESAKGVPAIDRALRVLEMLAAARKGLSVAEIARNLEVARSSAFYILRELERNGYVSRPEGRGRYHFTPKLFSLANSSLTGLSIHESARSLLQELVAQTRLTAHLGILVQGEVVIVERVAPKGQKQLPTWVGKRLPVHCTGTGKALMAYQSHDTIQRLVSIGLIRYNDNTIVSAAKFEEELARVRALGYALDDEEETIGLRCVGAPVFDSEKNILAACSLAGTVEQINESNLGMLSVQVKQTAAHITDRLQRKMSLAVPEHI